MAKAILELEMPDNCKTCPCCNKEKMYCEALLKQTGIVYGCLKESRRSDCPLKLVEYEEVKPCGIIGLEEKG